MPEIRFEGFCGPSYKSASGIVTADELINRYPERVESGTGKDRFALYAVPGWQSFVTVAGGPCRAMAATATGPGVSEYLFVLAGANLYKITAAGAATLIGTVATENLPGQIIVINPDLLFVLSAGQCYLSVPSTNTTTPVTMPMSFARSIAFKDNFVIASDVATRQFYISDVGDPNTWNPLNVATKEAAPDFLQAVFSTYDFLYLFGLETIEVWFTSGAANFPFQRYPNGGVIDTGCASPWAISKLDNTVIFLGRDTRGIAVVYMLRGQTPQRVSNHAIEALLNNSNAAIGDAISWSYQENGHYFWCLNIQDDPGINITLVYDVTTGQWHKRGLWSGSAYTRLPINFHSYAFFADTVQGPGHFIAGGAWGAGTTTIYRQSLSYYTFAGQNIRWQRTAPHLYDMQTRMRYDRLILDWDKTGTPSVTMRYSDDGGVNYGANHTVTAQAGQKRTIWRQLGSARDKVFELSGVVVNQNAISDAAIGITPESPKT